MKSKIYILATLLLSSFALPTFADSFYVNLNKPGIQIGVNAGESLPPPGEWFFEGQRHYGPPTPPRNPKDKKAWKRYKKLQKAYEKHLKQCHKKHHKHSPKKLHRKHPPKHLNHQGVKKNSHGR